MRVCQHNSCVCLWEQERPHSRPFFIFVISCKCLYFVCIVSKMLTDFDSQMKNLEAYAGISVPEGKFFILRLDGCSFSKMTERHFMKPFDDTFASFMDATCEALVSRFNVSYAFTQSDEISLLFLPNEKLFNRRVEKLCSVASGLASAIFSRLFIEPVVFDCRVVVADNDEHVGEYFSWRLSDGRRNALNSACYWKLRESLSEQKANTALNAFASADVKKLFLGDKWLFLHPRHPSGASFAWEKYVKDGKNPLTGELCPANRQKLVKETGTLERHKAVISRLIEEHRRNK